MEPTAPNFLVITCHDLGRRLGCYGARTVNTPSLDALAAAGTRSINAFATSPGCSPSRAAIATGRYPHSNGVLGLAHHPFGWSLAPNERHIAALLRDRGYTTHLFGLQHVTVGRVEALGFDTVSGRGHGRDVAARVAAFLAATPAERPCYIEVNLEEPHRPFDQGGVEADTTRGVQLPPYVPDSGAANADVAALQGAIREADRSVGQILQALDRAGRAKSTFVLFTTDHGVALPRAKGTLYDPGIETALLVRWPGVTIPGGTIDDLTSNVDLLPTLLDVANAPVAPTVQGRSFVNLLRGERSTPREAIFAEKTFHSYYDPMRAIRTARYKLIRNFEAAFQVEVPGDIQAGDIFRADPMPYSGAPHPPLELYDLAADPAEQDNLAGNPTLASVERELDGRLWQWMVETADPLLDGPVASPTYRQALSAWPRTAPGAPAAG